MHFKIFGPISRSPTVGVNSISSFTVVLWLVLNSISQPPPLLPTSIPPLRSFLYLNSCPLQLPLFTTIKQTNLTSTINPPPQKQSQMLRVLYKQNLRPRSPSSTYSRKLTPPAIWKLHFQTMSLNGYLITLMRRSKIGVQRFVFLYCTEGIETLFLWNCRTFIKFTITFLFEELT